MNLFWLHLWTSWISESFRFESHFKISSLFLFNCFNLALVLVRFFFPTSVLCSHDFVNSAGISSGKNSAVNFQGSPESAGPTEGDLISVQYYALPSASEPNEPDSESPKYVYYPNLATKVYSLFLALYSSFGLYFFHP